MTTGGASEPAESEGRTGARQGRPFQLHQPQQGLKVTQHHFSETDRSAHPRWEVRTSSHPPKGKLSRRAREEGRAYTQLLGAGATAGVEEAGGDTARPPGRCPLTQPSVVQQLTEQGLLTLNMSPWRS